MPATRRNPPKSSENTHCPSMDGSTPGYSRRYRHAHHTDHVGGILADERDEVMRMRSRTVCSCCRSATSRAPPKRCRGRWRLTGLCRCGSTSFVSMVVEPFGSFDAGTMPRRHAPICRVGCKATLRERLFAITLMTYEAELHSQAGRARMCVPRRVHTEMPRRFDIHRCRPPGPCRGTPWLRYAP